MFVEKAAMNLRQEFPLCGVGAFFKVIFIVTVSMNHATCKHYVLAMGISDRYFLYGSYREENLYIGLPRKARL